MLYGEEDKKLIYQIYRRWASASWFDAGRGVTPWGDLTEHQRRGWSEALNKAGFMALNKWAESGHELVDEVERELKTLLERHGDDTTNQLWCDLNAWVYGQNGIQG